MRLAIITDVHGNLPALEAALAEVDRVGVELLVHTGDAIGIGPFPRECLELLTTRPATVCLMGNHDAAYAFDLLHSRPEWMDLGEWQHQQWTQAAVGSAFRPIVAAWPYTLQLDSPAGTIELLHFPRGADGDFISPDLAPKSGEAADILFQHALSQSEARVVFYGHNHAAADLTGRRTRYLNPGSLGCAATAIARIAFLEVAGPEQWQLSVATVGYDPSRVVEEFERRAVPERAFIQRVFMPFGPGNTTT